MTEQEIQRVLGQDLSAGTEEFRDALLVRCLAALESDNQPADLNDEELTMLAAAGDAPAFMGMSRMEDCGHNGA